MFEEEVERKRVLNAVEVVGERKGGVEDISSVV
jgi:hypothetical protein